MKDYRIDIMLKSLIVRSYQAKAADVASAITEAKSKNVVWKVLGGIFTATEI